MNVADNKASFKNQSKKETFMSKVFLQNGELFLSSYAL